MFTAPAFAQTWRGQGAQASFTGQSITREQSFHRASLAQRAVFHRVGHGADGMPLPPVVTVPAAPHHKARHHKARYHKGEHHKTCPHHKGRHHEKCECVGKPGPAGPAGPTGPDIDVTFQGDHQLQVSEAGGHTWITPVGVSAAMDASSLPGYYSTPDAVDASETVMGESLFIDVVNASGQARQLRCTLNGASGLDGGANLTTACGHGTPLTYWNPITYP